VTLRRPDQL